MPRGGYKEGGGRRKGSLNKTTRSIKEAILEAFERAGGVEYLVKVANSDYKTFCALLGRVLPLAVNMDMTDRLAGFLNKLDGQNRQLPSLPAPEVIENERRFDS